AVVRAAHVVLVDGLVISDVAMAGGAVDADCAAELVGPAHVVVAVLVGDGVRVAVVLVAVAAVVARLEGLVGHQDGVGGARGVGDGGHVGVLSVQDRLVVAAGPGAARGGRVGQRAFRDARAVGPAVVDAGSDRDRAPAGADEALDGRGLRVGGGVGRQGGL